MTAFLRSDREAASRLPLPGHLKRHAPGMDSEGYGVRSVGNGSGNLRIYES